MNILRVKQNDTWIDIPAIKGADATVDNTLSVQGAAADAKKTGDEVSNLKSAIDAIADGNEQIDLALAHHPNIRFESVALQVEDYNYPITFYCNNSNYSFYVMYYDSNDAVISSTPWQKTKYIQLKSAIPANAVTMRMICKADDEHSLNDSEKTFFSAGSVAKFFVDDRTLFVSANGNDANNGTKESPLKTITRAIELNAKTILVAPATYSERLNFYNVNGLKIMPWSYGTFAAGDDDKKIILDGINTRPLLMYFENCTSITLVGVKVINFTNSGFKFKDCSGVHLIDCEAGLMYGSYQYGIGFEFINTNGDVESCYAHDVSLDGFNIHGFGTTRFVNCVATNCGDDGISHHDASIGYISGGEYSNCGKGGIASPTYGAVVNIDSAYCHDNLYGIYAVSNSNNRRSKALVNNCALKNNTNKDLYVDYADVTGWNNIYDTKTVGVNATFAEY